jgi:hypothetical protein
VKPALDFAGECVVQPNIGFGCAVITGRPTRGATYSFLSSISTMEFAERLMQISLKILNFPIFMKAWQRSKVSRRGQVERSKERLCLAR